MSDLWLDAILREYADEYTDEACERCDDCSKLMMCRFHSLLSLLHKSTFLNKEHAKSARAARY